MSGFGGSGFGGTQGGFGSSGFGGSNSSGFGGGQPPPPTGFGSQAPAAPFASSTSFGSGGPSFAAPAPFGSMSTQQFGNNSSSNQPPMTFGNSGFAPSAPAPASTPFGGSNTAPPGGFSGGATGPSFGNQNATQGFGAPQAPSGFGTPAGSSFVQQSGSSQFASSGSLAFSSPAPSTFTQPTFPTGTSGAFNQSSSSTFGNSTQFADPSQGQQTNSFGTGNPFGNATQGAPAPAMTFGTSANVVDMNMGDGNQSSHQGLSPFASSFTPTTAAPFAAAPPAPFPGQSAAGQSSGFQSPFGQQATAPADVGMGDGNTSDDGMGGTTNAARKPSSLPDSSMSPTPMSAMSPAPDDDEKQKQKLAKLKAKLAAKKKKLDEAKKKKSGQTPDNSPPPSPKASAKPGGSLAERNAARFASSKPQSSQLPSDLKTTNQSTIKDLTKIESDQLDLENAKSLVGLCQHMCPDDELKRRENESDIQMLEFVHPDIHPVGWNLRNTAVKRFRRSAADYKLDVPEWIRPPDVLERVCGYLEEWVMERDRQGPDPRFNTGQAPTPLEVYLFIWDRTRMVRKDFILQNYVGSGGKCDARAVRCHERIARWHIMCEHQLSHIPDFVTMQSQQNIAELGQAMKTLNLFYDDSLRRAVIDDPDEEGNEQRLDTTGFSHGCESDFVHGVSPVDFDGKALANDASTSGVPSRLIGPNAANTPARGTAEPEMRALYILLTVENDGGMEVLKYAAYLSKERPEVFRSQPVQLALEIFKAKHELNYARFFAILRSSSTPYLFACLMFKYVEELRRVAIRMMYMTYGYKKKGEAAIQDQYPLKWLGRLLCFEDMDEARETCQHYNITVKTCEVSSSSAPSGKKQIELIFWKATRFQIKKDPDKGVVVPLKPRKMLRTIESKLKGAIRLAVCRGEASGDGSTLASVPLRVATKDMSPEEQAEMMRMHKEKLEAESRRREDAARAKLEHEEQKRRDHEERRRKAELKEKMAEKKKQQELAKEKAEEARLQDQKRQQEREQEMKRKQTEEIERRRIEQEAAEEARRKAEVEAAEERRRSAEATARRVAAEKEAKRAAEEAEKERQRQEAIQKEKERLELEAKRKAEAEEKRRQDEERRRLALIKEKEEKERLEKLRKAQEEARRIAEEEAMVNRAKKILLWKRIKHKLARALHDTRTERTLASIDPTLGGTNALFSIIVDHSRDQVAAKAEPGGTNINDFLEALVLEQWNFDLGASLMQLLHSPFDLFASADSNEPGRLVSQTVLLKVSIFVPTVGGLQSEIVGHLVHKWIDSRLQYGSVKKAAQSEKEIRFVAVNGNIEGGGIASDLALVVIPPCVGGAEWTKQTEVELTSFDESVRVVALNLDDGSDKAYSQSVQQLLAVSCAEQTFDCQGDEMADFDNALGRVCANLLECSSHGTVATSIEKTSMSKLAADAIRNALHRGGTLCAEDVLARARAVMKALVDELEDLSNNFARSSWSSWPPSEFTEGNAVKGYYGRSGDLPTCWFQSLRRSYTEAAMGLIESKFDGSFYDTIAALLENTGNDFSIRCQSLTIRRQYAHCLDQALEAYGCANSFRAGDRIVFMPTGMSDQIFDSCARKLNLPSPSLVDNASNVELPNMTSALPRLESITAVATFDDECDSVATPIVVPEIEVKAKSFLPKRPHSDAYCLPRKRIRLESQEESHSRAFTAKLEAMVRGDDMIDMVIGDDKLSNILSKAPPLELCTETSVSEPLRRQI